MSPIVHLLLAWFLAIIFITKVEDRRLVIIAGVIAEIDAIFIAFNQELFYEFHHTFGHSLIFGILVAVTAGIIGKSKIKVTLVAFGAFLLHLIADIIGSNWAITPFYPLSDYGISAGNYLSNIIIYNVINPIFLILSFITVLIIIYYKEFSPLEFISKKFDEKIVGFYIYPIKYKCEICGRRAFTKCIECNKKVCPEHSVSIIKSKCSICSGKMNNSK